MPPPFRAELRGDRRCPLSGPSADGDEAGDGPQAVAECQGGGECEGR